MNRSKPPRGARRDDRRPGATPVAARQPIATVSREQPPSVERQALVVTHCFDPGQAGPPFTATVRITGRRVGSRGNAIGRDVFTHIETIEGVLPGSGPVTLTSWVYDIEPGDWTITATVSMPRGENRRGRPERGSRPVVEPISPASWSWRHWRISPRESAPIHTRAALFAPLARLPAVQPGTWPLLGTVAAAIALVVQAILLDVRGISPSGPVLVSFVALLAGMLGAKVWYAVLHPGPWKTALLGGWSVDGFFAVAPIVAAAGLVVLGLPAGEALDAVAPGLFLAVAIGRVGCLLTGCCAGRCTASRWGLWSSDRRVGARRIPAQLIEAAAGLAIAAVASVLLLVNAPGIPGAIFAASIVAYVVVRQLLLRIRAERREFSWRRAPGISPR